MKDDGAINQAADDDQESNDVKAKRQDISFPCSARIKDFPESARFRGNARRLPLPVDFYNDTGVQMAPSPVFPLPLTPLPRQAPILVVPFLQVIAVSAIFLLVIHVIVAALPIVVSLVAVAMVIVVGLNGCDGDKQGSAQQESTQVTFHLVVAPRSDVPLKLTDQSLGICSKVLTSVGLAGHPKTHAGKQRPTFTREHER